MPGHKVRVLMIFDELNVGGTEVHVFELIDALQRLGVYCVVACMNGPLYSKFKSLGCPVYLVNFSMTYSVPVNEWDSTMKRLHTIAETERIQIIHSHQPMSARYAAALAKERKIPIVNSIHGLFIELLPDASETIVVSHPLRQWTRQFGIHPHVIPNGINTRLFRPRHRRDTKKELGIPQGDLVVLYAARMVGRKAKLAKDFIRACRHIRKRGVRVHGLVVGDGPDLAGVLQVADRANQRLGTSFIHCLRHRFDMHRLYAASDCVVGTGRVAMEAMSCEKPVIAVGEGGYFGVVKARTAQRAWHCAFGDHGGKKVSDRKFMAHHMRKLLMNPAQRRRYGRQNRAFVIRKFGTRRIAQRVLRLYRKVLR